jgi:hypothetical protein
MTDTMTTAQLPAAASPRPWQRSRRRIAIAVGVAVVLAFVLSTTWYILFAEQRAALLAAPVADSSAPPAWMVALELVRSAVVASAIAVLASRFRVDTVGKALLLGLGTFVAFPGVLLSGSVLWDGTPIGLAAIHAGDWLIKLMMVSVVVVLIGRARRA